MHCLWCQRIGGPHPKDCQCDICEARKEADKVAWTLLSQRLKDTLPVVVRRTLSA